MKVKESIVKEIQQLRTSGKMILFHEAVIKKEFTDDQIEIIKKREDYKEYVENFIAVNHRL